MVPDKNKSYTSYANSFLASWLQFHTGWWFRNPAPVDMVSISVFTRFFTSQVVQDFLHQPYHSLGGKEAKWLGQGKSPIFSCRKISQHEKTSHIFQEALFTHMNGFQPFWGLRVLPLVAFFGKVRELRFKKKIEILSLIPWHPGCLMTGFPFHSKQSISVCYDSQFLNEG